VLKSLDMSKKLSKKRYENQLEELQARLSLGLRDKKFQDRSLAIVFEGSDAAGKGGAIRRVTPAMDVRKYHITPIASPTQEERLYPYLWRFWKHVPKAGHVAIFDRSWYGRVLVERVEGFCSEADWMRGYTEINEFEEQMHERGTEVIKFWLATSPEEQMRRFKEREATGFKRYKITEEDWRNRKKWPEYEWAVNDMVDRTSTEHAPWTLVEAEDKRYARIKVLKTIVQRLESIL
jgi:polyphosphate kinase 2 (PPK2 family)